MRTLWLAALMQARASIPVLPDLPKRREVPDRLMPGAAASVAFEEQMESLEGVVDPSELKQMRAEFLVRQFVNSIPPAAW